MIVIIQCAASKAPNAGHLVTADGKPVTFVAHPEIAPRNDGHNYARPDDNSDTGKSWREVLTAYNSGLNSNPLGLLPAYRLYENPVYQRLVDKLGIENVYILSAGWGLVRADFLTPYYDITFSPSADAFKRRRKKDRYLDFCMLQDQPMNDEIVFFGGMDYLPLLCTLTCGISNKKTVFYNSVTEPLAPGWSLKKFATSTKTNWHYKCGIMLPNE